MTGTVLAPAPAAPADPGAAELVRGVRRDRTRRTRRAVALLVLALLAALAVRVLLGRYTVTVPDFFAILAGEQIPGASFIVLQEKLPRAVLGAPGCDQVLSKPSTAAKARPRSVAARTIARLSIAAAADPI